MDAQNFLLHVLALHGCHHQGVFTAVKVVLLKWSIVCTTVTHLQMKVTHLHTNLEILCTSWVYIPVHIRLVLCAVLYTMYGTCTIKTTPHV